ncbi:hypothetical protein D3C78_1710850 [compost metagenome]
MRKEYARQANALRAERVGIFRKLGLDFLDLFTDQGYVKPLIKFFQSRQTRRGKAKRGA